MTAAELREALDAVIARKPLQPWPDRPAVLVGNAVEILADAARLWLRILEGDEQLVEKVSNAIFDYREERGVRGRALREARAVLAALAEGET